MSPGDRLAGKTEKQLGVTEKCFCHAACVVACEVVSIETPQAFFTSWHRYFLFPYIVVSLSGFGFLCKISGTETVSCNHTVPVSLKRTEPLTASDCY